MKDISAIILASDNNNEFKSKKTKYLHRLYGRTMIEWVFEAFKEANIQVKFIASDCETNLIDGSYRQEVHVIDSEKDKAAFRIIEALKEEIKNRQEGCLIIAAGNIPLLNAQTLSSVIEFHRNNQCSATVMEAKSNTSRSLDKSEKILCCFSNDDILQILDEAKSCKDIFRFLNDTLLKLLQKDNKRISKLDALDSTEMLAVKNRLDLLDASCALRTRILKKHMLQGVSIIDPSSTYIDVQAVIGMDTVIYPGSIIEGGSVIGEDCIIGPNTRLVKAQVGRRVEINNSVVVESSIGDDTSVGPFAYIRPESSIGSHVKIGDFVEIKKSVVGNMTKIPHLSYIGDTQIGENTNIGCGVITVNYNGREKNKTLIGNGAFVGCNVNLIAPVEIKDNSYIAAGSTITEEVPENSLAIARERQVIKENWVKKKGMQRKK